MACGLVKKAQNGTAKQLTSSFEFVQLCWGFAPIAARISFWHAYWPSYCVREQDCKCSPFVASDAERRPTLQEWVAIGWRWLEGPEDNSSPVRTQRRYVIKPWPHLDKILLVCWHLLVQDKTSDVPPACLYIRLSSSKMFSTNGN